MKWGREARARRWEEECAKTRGWWCAQSRARLAVRVAGNSYNYRGVYEQHQPTITRPIVIIERTGR
jgi:hypothetical protein